MTATEQLLDDLGRRARQLEATPADVHAVLTRAHAPTSLPRPRERRIPVLAIAGVLALLIVVMAIPTTRTAVAGAIDAFFGGQTPGHAVNGRELHGAQVPRWLTADTHRALLVAGTGKNRLIAYRQGDAYCFDYGAAVGECSSAHEWEHELAQHPVVLRGPTGGVGHPRGALYGFTRGDVATVRLSCADHPPITASARNGGFAIPTDARWQPQRLTLLSHDGQVIAIVDVADRFSVYR
ncbi:MAG: hypothetical protein ACRDL8_13990 [Solirubrobacteraceae bacterium]